MIFVIKTSASQHNIAPLHIKSISPLWYDENSNSMKFQVDIGSYHSPVIHIYENLQPYKASVPIFIEAKDEFSKVYDRLITEWSKYSDPNKAHLVGQIEFKFVPFSKDENKKSNKPKGE